MSDEAVVRIILTEGAGGAASASSSAYEHSPSAGSSSTNNPINSVFDRMYREMTRNVTETVRGFDRSMMPMTRKLGEIVDLLEEANIWDEKAVKQDDLSTAKLIGAIGRGYKAIGDEISKAAGLTSPDRVMVDAQRRNAFTVQVSNDAVVKAIDSLNRNLNPEGKPTDKMASAFSGGTVTAAFLATLKAGEYQKEIGAALGKAYGQFSGGAAAAGGLSGGMVQQFAGAAGDIGGFVGQNLEMVGGVGAIAAGAVLAVIGSILSPKEEKEKSTNELLADISSNTEDTSSAITSGIDTSNEISRDVMSISVLNKSMDDSLNEISRDVMSISALIGGKDNTAANSAMIAGMVGSGVDTANSAMLAGMSSKTTVHDAMIAGMSTPRAADQDLDKHRREWEELQIKGGYGPEVPADFAPARHSGPDWTGDNSTIPPVLEESGLPDTGPYEPDLWQGWTPPDHEKGWNLDPDNLHEMRSSGWPGAGINYRGPITGGEYEQYWKWRREQGLGPPGFAKGGAVGTDTVPAMLSPGEVVVPRYMVEGGAVDHLRGMLPGFATGGLVGMAKAGLGATFSAYGSARNFAVTASSDTGGSISQMGAGISGVGEKLSTALPMVGGFVMALGKGTEAFGKLVGAINEVAERYGEFSPEIASAQAMAEIAQTMGDMRRAQEVGPELAKFIVAQSEMQQKFEDLKIKLLMQIVPAVTRILEIMDMGIEVQGIETAIQNLTTPLAALASVGAEMAGAQRDSRLPAPDDPSTMLLNKNFEDAGAGRWVPDER